MLGFPVLWNIKDLSMYIHISTNLLYKLSKYNDKYYMKFTVPKKNGKNREICCPSKEMKAVQAWILRNIIDKINISNVVTGFVSGKNISNNVKPHLGNRFFLCLDIEDFFPSIEYKKIYNIFKTVGYNPHVCHILASMCTCDGKLPQGGVTSPSLSNIACIRMDNRISGYVGKRNISYTRYADDLVFSSLSDVRLFQIKKFVLRIIQEEGFCINTSKTRIMGPCQQRKITGLIVSDDSFGIGRKMKRILRAKIHKLETKILTGQEETKLKNHLDGWYAYLNSVDKNGYNQLRKFHDNLKRNNKNQKYN